MIKLFRFAIQNGDACWCQKTISQKYDVHGPSENCRPCLEPDSTFCGGGWANSVYRYTSRYVEPGIKLTAKRKNP